MFANGSVAMFLFQVSLIYSEATSNIQVHITCISDINIHHSAKYFQF